MSAQLKIALSSLIELCIKRRISSGGRPHGVALEFLKFKRKTEIKQADKINGNI